MKIQDLDTIRVFDVGVLGSWQNRANVAFIVEFVGAHLLVLRPTGEDSGLPACRIDKLDFFFEVQAGRATIEPGIIPGSFDQNINGCEVEPGHYLAQHGEIKTITPLADYCGMTLWRMATLANGPKMTISPSDLFTLRYVYPLPEEDSN